MKKKILSILLSMSLAAGSFGTVANCGFVSEEAQAATSFVASPELKQKIKDIILDMYETGDTSRRYIRDLNLKSTDYYKIVSEFEEEIYNSMAYNSGNYNILQSDKDADGYVISIYLYKPDLGYAYRYEKMKQVINYCHEQMKGMSDIDKIIWINDFLVNTADYVNDESDLIVHAAAGPLTLGYCVCQGYAEAMEYLLDLEGIDNYYVSSSNHGWIGVKIDGEYYHVDPTWNDTRNSSKMQHYYLLRNDEEFNGSVAKHDAWKYDITKKTLSSSTKFTDWYVHRVKERMYYYGGMWYYVLDGKLYKNDAYGKKETLLADAATKIQGITNGALSYTNGKTVSVIDLTGKNDKAVKCTHANSTLTGKVEPTCKLGGYTGDKICNDCKVITEVGNTVPVKYTGTRSASILSHEYEEGVVIKEATATTKGEVAYKCKNCYFVDVRATDKLPEDHVGCRHANINEIKYTAPTCAKVGIIHKTVCVDCNKVVYAGNTIKKLEHIWDNGTVTKESTTLATGVRTYKCTKCTGTKTEVIDKIPMPKSVKSGGLVMKDCEIRTITMNWPKVSGVDGYVLSIYKGGKWVDIKPFAQTKTTYKVTALEPGVQYRFRIKTFKNVNGNKVYSNYVYANGITRPTAVQITSLTKTTKGLKVSYKKNNATEYYVQYATKSDFSDVKNIKVSGMAYKVILNASLKKGKTYYIRVRARKCLNNKVYYGAFGKVWKYKW